MANKSRPSKVTAPYRKYVAGQGFTTVRASKTNKLAGASTNTTTTKSTVPPEMVDVISTPQGYYYYNEETESIVHIKPVITEEEMIKIQTEKEQLYKDIGPMKLPFEIQSLIIKYSAIDSHIDVSFALVCKTWYLLVLPLLYQTPRLTSQNFSKFINTVLNTSNSAAAKKNNKYALVKPPKSPFNSIKFGEYVHELDLSTILQSGKNSNVSKLLRRCSHTLEKFTAPQTSFGIAPLISLKACHNLNYLDLGLVSETVKLKDLFVAIKNFQNLTHLSFPRSSVDCEGFQKIKWPENLKYIKLSGGITNEFVQETEWPQTIKTLEFSYCPRINENSIYIMLSKIGNNLENLYFHYPMPSLNDNSLDNIFLYCENLINIKITIDYCSKWIFNENYLTKLHLTERKCNKRRPLQTIYLESSGSLGIATKIHPDDFTIALMEDRLPCLKNISVSSKLGWDMNSEDVEDLVSVMEDQGGSIYVTY
ncbi:hypothetical protein TBLA_0A02980 [Henningerozyma blattae CBS 6284]|uniref:F-box domain-containing protein n=1 Tax=Henningerozyma blattae (strain ATCC 34711 / CBS 6284 / DSM 70876 / NBRC 10599 / NRRL Y-10934 / UCD 77-7) TaxID=1071380 RepID=I2GVE6_HENB6|nr:hypothetical protein TBLA_0A02980 [Tetrapisispora blattae CBS 6284]CCH58098.1 hypothetical protein TBLA_0A02980 [Tetrapisispora blattae CBS 6284]